MSVTLKAHGLALWSATSVGQAERALLRQSLFRAGEAGARCLLDIPAVAVVARAMGRELIEAGVLAPQAVAVQAIAFDKSAGANWKVAWHQDLMFPFARPVSSPGYSTPSVKDGVNFACPPRAVLEGLLAVRLHLDDCDEENGPLRVIPGSHLLGIIPSAEIREHSARMGEFVCTAKEGEAWLMRPLLLHASSKAVAPRNRRVLHLVYYSGPAIAEAWHRALVPGELRESI